jgi:hypothetical protein
MIFKTGRRQTTSGWSNTGSCTQRYECELIKNIALNPKGRHPNLLQGSPIDSTAAKFMFDRINIAQATYHWSNAATASNFKLALRGKAVYWLNNIKNTHQINISLWFRIEPQFKCCWSLLICFLGLLISFLFPCDILYWYGFFLPPLVVHCW